MAAYVYIESERYADDSGFTHVLYTVGHYTPVGKWVAESDHEGDEDAAARVNYLNGGDTELRALLLAVKALWDKHGLGDDEAESEPVYARVCAALGTTEAGRHTRERATGETN